MSDETKGLIEQMTSYYGYHSMTDMVSGDEERLRNFVTDDFTKLLAQLKKELDG